MRFRLILTLAALAGSVSTAALTRNPPTPEQRIERLEKQVRQVQKQVFPKGQPADTAGFSDAPAASQSSVVDLSARIDSLEKSLSEITRQSEENGHRLSTMEADLARLRADADSRFKALETAPPPAPAAAAPPAEGSADAAEPAPPPAARPPARRSALDRPPPAPTPKVETDAAAEAKPAKAAAGKAASPDFNSRAEAAYDLGYQRWLKKDYDGAVVALRQVAAKYPGHRRVSWANNLAGRALLDSGQPRAAAETLLANYRKDPKGERAPDSLYYLGQALMRLNQPSQACKAYSELQDVYGASLRADLKKQLASARSEAGCK